MATVLHVQASPRGTASASIRVARAFLESYQQSHPGDKVETLDLFATDLPAFDAPAAAAKYSVMGGEEPKDREGRAWKRVIEVIDYFKSADKIVMSTPMWNFGIPYRLKQYIDVIVQPGLTFSYTPGEGYKGLVTGKPVVLILARGGAYPAGTDAAAYDMQRPYLEGVLKFIGFADVRAIVVEPMLMQGPDVAERKVQEAIAQARAAAGGF